VVYSAAAAARSGAQVLVVTRIARADRAELRVFEENGAEVHPLDSAATTSIHNRYETDDHERRTVKLLQGADPYTLEDLPGMDARIYELGGLYVGDIPVSLIEPLSKRGAVALDAQGVVRHVVEGRMEFGDWEEKRRYLPYVTYLKTDAAEAELLTGESDRERAARMLQEMGAREVMVTHHEEVILAAGDELLRAPLTPRNLKGRTGRGDTCFAAYLAWNLTHGREEALRYAAALVSIKMETPGVFQGSPTDVVERIV
jgi:sugar/nucleoside kinase (ribokinase family)